MKALKSLIAAVVLTSAFVCPVRAFTIDPSLTFLGAVDFNNGPNDPATNLAALNAFLVGDGMTPLSGSTALLSLNFENLSGAGPTINDVGGQFIVIHFGKGMGGTGSGGSWEFFSVNGPDGVSMMDTLPSSGGDAGNDPFGHGGISSARVFSGSSGSSGENVPDGGTTVMLLGTALTGLGVMRRYLKR